MRRVQADLRRLPYSDGTFDAVLCVSTLEHVGRDNARYGLPPEARAEGGDVAALRELERILAPGGRLLVTVPFGRREDHGWLVQYDGDMWERLLMTTSLEVSERDLFRLGDEGWVREDDPASMSELSYREGAPAARGVLCAVLVKPAG